MCRTIFFPLVVPFAYLFGKFRRIHKQHYGKILVRSTPSQYCDVRFYVNFPLYFGSDTYIECVALIDHFLYFLSLSLSPSLTTKYFNKVNCRPNQFIAFDEAFSSMYISSLDIFARAYGLLLTSVLQQWKWGKQEFIATSHSIGRVSIFDSVCVVCCVCVAFGFLLLLVVHIVRSESELGKRERKSRKTPTTINLL